MLGLAHLIFVIVAPTLAGIALAIALVAGADTGKPILIAVVIGTLIAVPVSWLIAKKLREVKGLIKKA